MVPRSELIHVIEHGKTKSLRVTREGVGPLETSVGRFHHFAFNITDEWKKYSVLVMAELSKDFTPLITKEILLMRIDSGCETGQMFGDLTCECRDQLLRAMEIIAQQGEGMVINIPRQDGRGMGLPFKLATLQLQTELKLNTVESSTMLDPDGSRDTRTYSGVVAILKYFMISNKISIKPITNNPDKMKIFHENNYKIIAPQSVVIPPTEYTRQHLIAKQKELGHINLIEEKSCDSEINI